MHLLFETRLDILRVAGETQFLQCTPTVHPHPVLCPDTYADGMGASLYGSVLHDGGRFRMWYQAWPKDWSDHDSAAVAYAESDDGITWRKPHLGLVECGGTKANHLVNMGVHTPSVYIDPHSPPSHRYRATGAIDRRYALRHADASDAPLCGGYYTLHSSDGFDWKLDSPTWAWPGADNLYTIWHPGRDEALTLMKVHREYAGMGRRSWMSATIRNGVCSPAHLAIVPDDFADVAAAARGMHSADYYGIGLMPAGGQSTVGFLQTFYHRLPLKSYQGSSFYGNLGHVEITLVHQSEPRGCWQHAPGRKTFLSHQGLPWATDGIYVGANVIDIGNEQRLYFCGTNYGHNRPHLRPSETAGFTKIGYASWPKNRLFGFTSDRHAQLDLDLGVITKPSRLALNFQTETDGCLQVELLRIPAKEVFIFAAQPIPGRTKDDAVPLRGDHLSAHAAWKDTDLIAPSNGDRIVARLHLDWSKVFAFELQPGK